MKTPEKETKIPYLSPSAFKIFEKDREDYYLKYLAPTRAPRFPQTEAMSIGSAFDAFAKAYLYEHFVGDGNEEYTAENLFLSQVEPHNRTWAREHGEWLFDFYKRTGALDDLVKDLNGCIGHPRFEFKLQGTVRGSHGSVVLLGKPDIFFVNREGASVILDFKINGYCSNHPKSPEKGYIKLRDDKQSYGQHKECMPMNEKGVMINVRAPLEMVNKDWAMQCAAYSWLLGEDIGSRTIVGIEQVACKPSGGKHPHCKVASHRAVVTPSWQVDLFRRMVEAWQIINSDWFFRHVDPETSHKMCERLDKRAADLHGDPNKDKDAWHAQMMSRDKRRF